MNSTLTTRRSTPLASAFVLGAMALCNLFVCLAHAQETAVLENFEASSPAISSNLPVANVFEMLAARGIATNLQGKDLTAAFRMLRVAPDSETSTLFRRLRGDDGAQTPWDDLHYTRGDVISFAGNIYLVAYQIVPPSNPEELQSELRWIEAWQNGRMSNDSRPDTPFLQEKSRLSLSLLALGPSVNLNGIRAFDPEKDMLTEKVKSERSVQIERAMSQTNLKQVSLAVMQYVQDYDEQYPPMRAARSLKEFENNNNPDSSSTPVQVMLMPYAKNNQIFLHPKTQRPYLPNYKISRMNLSAIKSPAETFLFYEDAPDAEGMRNVAFADGHVKAFREADFHRMRKAQGISESGFPAVAPKVKPKPKINLPIQGSSGTADRRRAVPSMSVPPPPASPTDW